MYRKRLFGIRKQHGVTLIEVIGAIAVASTLLLGLSFAIDNSLDDIKGQQAASYQSQVAAAARKYLAANYSQLVAGTASSGSVVAVALSAMQSGGFLPATFASVNNYGQAPCMLVKRNASAMAPAKLDAIVFSNGGQPIPDRIVPVVAMSAGAEGGYISGLSPATAQGASWQLDTTPYRGANCGGAALTGGAGDGGHLVSALFYDGPGQLSTDFVYRSAVPGHPELNQMNTPLLMASNALVTAGTACGTNAGLALDSTSRILLTCGTDGIWKSAASGYWKDPVVNYTDLPSTGSQAGDVRMVTSLNRAFTFGGSGWIALAVDQNGNLSVPNNLTVGGNGNIGNNLVVAQNVRANSVDGTTSVHGGYLKSDNFTQTGEINLYHYKNPGDACNIPIVDNGVAVHVWPIGTVLLDNNNLPLVCAYDATFRYSNGKYTP